jgi:hypothetical protein
MGILSTVGKIAKFVGKAALDQTSLTEKGRKKIAQFERDEIRRLKLKEARRREYEDNVD